MKILKHQNLKALVVLLLISGLSSSMLVAQDSSFFYQLEQSQYLKKVMKEDPAHAGFTRWTRKMVDDPGSYLWPRIFLP